MISPNEVHADSLGELRGKVLEQTKKELRMNLSLLEMLKGNTPLEDLANLREEWIEPLKELIDRLECRG